MVQLRDGTTVEDPRLGRLVEFDSRSRRFPIRELFRPDHEVPQSMHWALDVVLDQGPDGACVGFGWTHELIAEPVPIAGLDHQFAKETVYWGAQRIDQWRGGEYPGGDPQYSGTSVLSGAKVLRSMGYIPEFRWAFGLEDTVLAVGHHGPAVLGIHWRADMGDTDANGYIHASGDEQGGHCICMVGVEIVWKEGSAQAKWTDVDLTQSYAVLHNSWGPSWGVNGEAKIILQDLGDLLKHDGEASIPVQRALGRIA